MSPTSNASTGLVAPVLDPAVVAGRVLPARRELLHDIRWRPPDRNGRRTFVALAIALLLQIVLMLLTREWMRLPPIPESRDVVHVRLVELPPPPVVEPAPVHELPPLEVSAPPTGTARNAPAPPRPERGTRPVAPPAPGAGVDAVVATPSAPTLYNADGTLKISPQLAAPPSEPRDPMTRGKAAARELALRGHNIVRCKSTRFARAYSPDESAGAELARKYGAYVGLYNAHTAKETAERAADAIENCDFE